MAGQATGHCGAPGVVRRAWFSVAGDSVELGSRVYFPTPMGIGGLGPGSVVRGHRRISPVLRYWNDMLTNYYTLMGWDPATGIPLPETLEGLGIGYVNSDLEELR